MKRLHYVDALRSFCMLYGVFLHTCTLGNFGLLELIPLTSDYFRMATFFLVSAFLAGLMIDRTGWRSFVPKRSVALLVPFATALLVLNPPTLWLIYTYFDNPPLPPLAAIEAGMPAVNDVRGPAIWHLHLWFLLSLYVYVISAAPILAALRSRGGTWLLARLDAIPSLLVPLALAFCTACFVIALRILQEVTAPASSEIFVIRATVLYFPFYALGLALYVTPSLWEKAHRIDPLLIAVSVCLVIMDTINIIPRGTILAQAFDMFTRAMITGTAIFALLWLFRKIASPPSRITSILGASIYTVYLVHFFLIYAIASLLKPTGLEGPALFFVTSLSAIALGLALHFWVVDRSPVLTFLLNGRPPKRPKPAAQT